MHRPDDDGATGRDHPDDDSHPDDAPHTVYGGGAGGRGSSRRPTPRQPSPAARPRSGDEPARAPRSTDRPPRSARPARPSADDQPYTVYRAQPARFGRRSGPATPGDDDQRWDGERGGGGGGGPAGPRERRRRGRRGLPLPRRRWVCLAGKLVVGWVVLSAVLFVVSATVHQNRGDADALLGGGGAPFTPTNLLVLGTDSRPPGSKEPGAEGSQGSARTDTMMLLRTGGFANAKLSIPRDTLVEIPGHGTQKINAAYAFDGVRGAVRAVETLTGIDVNHVATIDFENFPQLIDAMGGVRITAESCLTADVSGGAKRPRKGVTIGYDKFKGGTSFRLEEGETYRMPGSAALAYARVRKNECDAGQDDLNRAERQQQVLGAMKRRILSPTGFLRMPMIAWKAPQAVTTDMGGFSLLGVAVGQFLPGKGTQTVLKPSGVGNDASGGVGLVVSSEEVARARRKFEK
ncbi:MAG: LCP family protein [Patulibacter sp.]|nr:LCP family protein [Patulibacter sp.]